MSRTREHDTAIPPQNDGSGYSELSFVEALAHPNEVFGRPEYVINHPSLSHQEKRIILLSWVRDELVNEQLAAEALPELKPHSRIDAVLDGLSRFDTSAAGEYLSAVSSIRRRRDAR